jgi:hypothetical protein
MLLYNDSKFGAMRNGKLLLPALKTTQPAMYQVTALAHAMPSIAALTMPPA